VKLPWRFPDPMEEARQRCQAFQRLSPEERWRLMGDTIAAGFALRRESGIPGATRTGPPPPVPELLEGALRLAQAARRTNLANALVGGLGTAFWTETRFMRRIAFVLDVPLPRLPGFVRHLQECGFVGNSTRMEREWARDRTTTLSFRGIPVRLWKPALRTCQHILDRAIEDSRLGRPIRVAPAEGLIVLQLLTWRIEDQMYMGDLVAAHRDTLDLDWIRSEWATLADPADPRLARLAELVAGRREERPMERE
jgi:hypothetical protein